jgi:pilus assembly protein CpaC
MGSGLAEHSALTFSSAGSTKPTYFFDVLNRDSRLIGLLDALRKAGQAKVLAEPTLVVINGRPCMFQEGGQFPLPVVKDAETLTTEYKNYGIELDVVPLILTGDRVRLQICAKLIGIDEFHNVLVGDQHIPVLRTSQVETGVELHFGQTLVLGGMTQAFNDITSSPATQTADWVSMLGMLPKPAKAEGAQTEVLLLVTPEVIEAVRPSTGANRPVTPSRRPAGKSCES